MRRRDRGFFDSAGNDSRHSKRNEKVDLPRQTRPVDRSPVALFRVSGGAVELTNRFRLIFGLPQLSDALAVLLAGLNIGGVRY
mmetsp:Transcript_38746/g.109579  ORF Transcript_38746/g.109579 Transcript_38746/m.109579 type:complete len:83 (-) Transcript_38746:25-273(-)